MNAGGVARQRCARRHPRPTRLPYLTFTYLTVPTHKKHFLFSRTADSLSCLPPVSNTGVVKPLRRETWKLYELFR